MIIDDRLLDNIRRQAQQSPRLRMNFNLHDSPDANAQRMINVLLPGTVLPVHRHPHTAETYLMLKGRMEIVYYDDNGTPTDRFLLDPADGKYGLQIPPGQWHTVNVIFPSAILEVKDGPYIPLSPINTLSINPNPEGQKS